MAIGELVADLIAVNDIIEARFVTHAGQQYAVNVRHFRVLPNIVGTVDMNTVALAFAAKYAPLYKALLSQTATFYGLGVRRISPTVTLETVTTVSQGAGLVAGDLMSTQTASVISLRTALPGRKFRGRAFIPFASETDNDVNARPTAGYLVTLNSLAQPFGTDQLYTNGAANFHATGVIWHRNTKTDTTIAAVFTRQDWGTQRRRSQINRPDRAPF